MGIISKNNSLNTNNSLKNTKFVQSKKTFIDTTNMSEEEKKKALLKQELEKEVLNAGKTEEEINKEKIKKEVENELKSQGYIKPKKSRARGTASMIMAIVSFCFMIIPILFYISSSVKGNVIGSILLFWLFMFPFQVVSIIIGIISFITTLIIFFAGKKTAGVIIGLIISIVAVLGNSYFLYYFITLSQA